MWLIHMAVTDGVDFGEPDTALCGFDPDIEAGEESGGVLTHLSGEVDCGECVELMAQQAQKLIRENVRTRRGL